MKRILHFLLIISLGCSAPQVVSFYDEKSDFGEYKTYRIVNPADRGDKISKESEQKDKRIEDAISREMDARGYQYDPKSSLKVYYRILLDSKADRRVNNNYYGRPYNSPYPYDYNVTTREYSEGILIIDMKDRNSKKTVWNGSLDLEIKSRSKKKVDPVENAIYMIFQEYPFEAGSSTPKSLE